MTPPGEVPGRPEDAEPREELATGAEPDPHAPSAPREPDLPLEPPPLPASAAPPKATAPTESLPPDEPPPLPAIAAAAPVDAGPVEPAPEPLDADPAADDPPPADSGPPEEAVRLAPPAPPVPPAPPPRPPTPEPPALGPDTDLRITADRLTWAFVALGAIACFVRYGVCLPLGPDESYLSINIARRNALELLTPLDYHQVAPPLFLLVERLLTRVWGFNEWALRIVPCVLAVVSLGVFRALARRVLSGWAFVAAVGIFCASYWIVRYGSEAKPYAFDLLISATFSVLALRWRETRSGWGLTAALSALAFVSFGFSFPAIFVGGGVVLFMGVTGLPRDHRVRLWQAAVVGTSLVTGFAVGYALHAAHQVESELTWMQDYWDRAFPPLTSLREFAIWLVRRASGELMPYPVGGKDFGSIMTLLCFLAGLVVLLRRKRIGVLWLLLAPVALTFVAACLKRYPFGAPTRCQLHLAPVFAIVAGAGLAALLLPRGATRLGHQRMWVTCGGLALISALTMARDILQPSKTSTDEAHRDLARVVWKGGDETDRPVLSLREDLGVSFSPQMDEYQTHMVTFLCNYYIYRRPNRGTADEGAWDDGVRVVNHRVFGKFDPALRQAWIEAFEAEHGLRFTGAALVPIPQVDNRERIQRVDVIEILTFDPPPAS